MFSRAVTLPVGADPDWASLARHRDPAVRRVAALSERLPFAAGAFDVVLASWVLEHLPQPERACAEIARVLKPGGRFVFLTPNALSPITVLNRLTPQRIQGWLVERLYARAAADTFPLVYRANTPAALAALAAGSGFSTLSLSIISDPTYLAFNDLLFGWSVWLEKRLPANRYVHLVGEWRRE